jgi:hypothetical protein
MSLQIILAVLALVSFSLGAAGVAARVNWDQLGKALLVAAWLAGATGL